MQHLLWQRLYAAWKYLSDFLTLKFFWTLSFETLFNCDTAYWTDLLYKYRYKYTSQDILIKFRYTAQLPIYYTSKVNILINYRLADQVQIYNMFQTWSFPFPVSNSEIDDPLFPSKQAMTKDCTKSFQSEASLRAFSRGARWVVSWAPLGEFPPTSSQCSAMLKTVKTVETAEIVQTLETLETI